MRISRMLAEQIALGAVAEPYRQVDVMSTVAFADWLEARAQAFSWPTLHHLWSVGVLHPILVMEPALDGVSDEDGRFAPIDLDLAVPAFLDLGTDVADDVPLRPMAELPDHFGSNLLWHPFQLWQLRRLAVTIGVSMELGSFLMDPEQFGQFSCRALTLYRMRERVLAFTRSEEQHEFLRVLALTLLAEPLVHLTVNPAVRSLPDAGESFEGYLSWLNRQDGAALLEAVGLSLEQLEAWHRRIALQADGDDPLAVFRVLLRHASRDKRARMKGMPLLAHDLYDAAEVVRRYVERYHDRLVLEEDVVRHGPKGAAIKKRVYGAERTADFDRPVFRRIARQFGVDPQARTTWLVEGDTEGAFIKHLAEMRGINLPRDGIELVNLRGLGGLDSDRLRDTLDSLRREEVFTFIAMDYDDRDEYVRLIRHYASQGLVTAGFRIWRPDFEEANFSFDELAAVANGIAAQTGQSLQLTADTIQRAMVGKQGRIGVGKAITKLLNAASVPGGKGRVWGKSLADWAAQNPHLPGRDDEERPIISLLHFLLRGQESSYAETVRRFVVDADGSLVEKPPQQDSATSDK